MRERNQKAKTHPSPRFMSPRLTCAGALVLCAAGLVSTESCILADPPADLPYYPPIRPTIVKGSVFPPTEQVIVPPLPTFMVPVELVDPNVTFEWKVFVDFDSVDRPTPVLGGDELPQVGTVDGGVRFVNFALGDLIEATKCHTVEFSVARTFNITSPHTPNPPGGDSVTWFVNPSGSLEGCPQYSAQRGDAGDGGDAADAGKRSDGGS